MIVAISNSQLVVIAIGVVAVAAFVSWLLILRRRHVLEALARRRGLHFRQGPDGPRVTGPLNARRVDIGVSSSSSDRDLGGVAVLQMSVSLTGVPAGMTVEEVLPAFGPLIEHSADRVAFSESEFARHVVVKGSDESAIRAYWTPARQAAFLELVRTAECDQVALQHGALVAEWREILSDLGGLDQLLDLLLSVAPELDGDDRC